MSALRFHREKAHKPTDDPFRSTNFKPFGAYPPMKPKIVTILIAFLTNLGLLLASSPGPVRASEEQSSSFYFPCCRKTPANAYCCQNCCFLRWDCKDDVDCR